MCVAKKGKKDSLHVIKNITERGRERERKMEHPQTEKKAVQKLFNRAHTYYVRVLMEWISLSMPHNIKALYSFSSQLETPCLAYSHTHTHTIALTCQSFPASFRMPFQLNVKCQLVIMEAVGRKSQGAFLLDSEINSQQK